ncbi:MAG: hypothetical protein R3B90_00050 [Planctomycetaceae bacterium]
MNAKSPSKLRWVMRLGVLTGLLLSAVGGAVYTGFEEEVMQLVGWPDSPQRAVKRQLRLGGGQSLSGVDEQSAPVHEFFRSARSKTRDYAGEVLGWSSKWKLVKDYVTSGEEHSEFLRERFNAMVFSEDELNQVVEAVVAAHLRHIEDVESEMLVRLEADLERLPADTFSSTIDRAAIAATLEVALQDAVSSAQGDLRAAVGRELASWIAGEIITQATIQLATSTGILSTGAASGTVTFGVGIVVGLIVDAIVTEIYNQAYDPAGKLSDTLNNHLWQLETLVLEGTGNSPGLLPRLRQYTRQRGENRSAPCSRLFSPWPHDASPVFRRALRPAAGSLFPRSSERSLSRSLSNVAHCFDRCVSVGDGSRHVPGGCRW